MSLTRRNLLKGLAVSPVLLSPTLLSACADRGSDTKAGTLNVGQISDSVAFFPLFIAEKRKFFTDEGLTLGDRPRLGTGAKLAAALKSGSIDVAAGVLTDAFNLATSGGGTDLLTSLVTQYYVDVIVSQDLATASEDASLDAKIQQLVGKKIGITGPGSGTEALVVYLFDRVGKDASTDATLVNLGSEATAAIGALQAGRVDALSFFQPIGQIVEAEGIGTISISPAAGDIPDLAGALHGVTFSTPQIAGKKKSEVASFQTAIGRALEVLHGEESQMRELLGEYLDTTPPDALDSLVPILRREVPAEPAVAKGAYEIGRRFHLESGLVNDPPSYQAAVSRTST
jgi:NitT/TauT family transport system substrate-binding protein